MSSILPPEPISIVNLHLMKKSYCILFLKILFILSLIPYAIANWDPYEVIGVKRDASLDQIKKAYRELARKLHPDKSNLSEDESGRKFIELNKAFNILKDSARRSRFDQNGETEENRHSRGHYGSDQYRRPVYRNGYSQFTFYSSSSDSYLKKKSITREQYHNDLIRDSRMKPIFIFFFSDFCPPCNMLEGTWSKITEELAKYNIGSFTINVNREPRLSQELGVNSIPHIACLIDGQLKSYHHSEISIASVVKFTKSLLPNNLINLLSTEEEQDRFITLGPQQNKLSAIIIHNEKSLKLRYQLVAYELRFYYRFGQVSTKLSYYNALIQKYNITLTSTKTYLLVFDENFEKPVIDLHFTTENADTIAKIRKHLYQWPFLKLPRISSQQKFDDLCVYTIPKDGIKTSRRLCVILFATDTPSSQPMRKKLVEFIETNNFVRDVKVAFAFIEPNKQKEFVSSLLLETRNTYPFLARLNETVDSAIILIERQPNNNRKALHKWLSFRWNPKDLDELDRAKLELYNYIVSYKNNIMIIKDKVALDILYDEDGSSLADRVFWRFFDHLIRTIYYITSGESFSTIIVLIICALITSLFLYQSPTLSNLNGQQSSFNQNDGFSSPVKQENSSNTNNISPSPTPPQYNYPLSDEQLKIIELKAQTYNGMVRSLKPGCRSIVLLMDNGSRDKWLETFKKIVWPYRRNKTLLFGYLCLDKNLNWYKALLQEVLDVGNLNVNKRKCIGTVLSLNGFKKYFRVYHAKHHEIDYYDNETDNGGSFLGFDDDDEEHGYQSVEDGPNHGSSNETLCTVDNLLDRLPIWLDKMFDGMTKRYSVNSWPEEMN